VCNEVFIAEFHDIHFALLRQVVLGMHDQRELILQYFRCQQLRVARHKGNRTKVNR